MARKLVFLILVCFALLNLVSATTPSYIFQRLETTDIKIPCYNETYHICPSTTTCNITIFYPNNSVLINNDEMTYADSYFNYTILNTQLTEDGEYYAATSCYGTTNGYSTFTFLINTSGHAYTSSEILTFIASLVSLIVVGIFLFGISNVFKDAPAIKYLLIGLSAVTFFTILLYTAISLAEFMGGFDNIISSYSSFVYAIFMIIFVIFIFILLRITIKAIEAFKIKRGLAVRNRLSSR